MKKHRLIGVILATCVSLMIAFAPQDTYGLSDKKKKLLKKTCAGSGIVNRWITYENDLLHYAASESNELEKTGETILQIEEGEKIDGMYQKMMDQFAVTDLFVNSEERVTPDPPDTEVWEMLKNSYSQETTTELDMTFTYSLVLREKLAAYNQVMQTYEDTANNQDIDFRTRLRLQNRLDNTENQLLAIRAEANRNQMCQRIQLAERKEQLRKRMEKEAAERNKIKALMR